MVDQLSPKLAAEYYKAFLLCAGKLIRTEDGTITAYDGDRIMAVFVGGEQSGQAVRTALKLNWAVQNVINPQFSATYEQYHRPLQHTVGIDRGQLLVAKTGVRGENDLVWVGAAANYAAKLNSFDGLDPLFPIRATKQVIDSIGLDAFTFSSTGATVWDGPYTNLDRGPHYRTAGTIGI
jgi:class 3 adenylate cyclase